MYYTKNMKKIRKFSKRINLKSLNFSNEAMRVMAVLKWIDLRDGKNKVDLSKEISKIVIDRFKGDAINDLEIKRKYLTYELRHLTKIRDEYDDKINIIVEEMRKVERIYKSKNIIESEVRTWK